MANTKRFQKLGIALEETAGTPVAPQHFIPFLSCELAEKQEIIADNAARGTRMGEGGNAVIGKKSGEGKIEVVLDPETFPYWAALAMGSIASEVSDDNYKHTITLKSDNDPLTCTIYRDRVVDEIQCANAVVNSMEIAFSDDVAKVSVDIKSKFPTSQSRSGSVADLKLFTFKNAEVEIGESTIKVNEFNLKIENDAELIYAPGDNDVDRIVFKTPKITGSFKLLFEDETQKDAFVGLTKQAMTITFTGEDDGKIVITIPQFRVENWGEDGGIDDVGREAIEFMVEDYDESGEEMAMSIEVTNSVPEYLGES